MPDDLRYSVWLEAGGMYAVIDTVSGDAAIGKDELPLVKLPFKLAKDLADELNASALQRSR